MLKHLTSAAIVMAVLPSIASGYTLEKAGGVFKPATSYSYDSTSCTLPDGTTLGVGFQQVQDSTYELQLAQWDRDFAVLATPLVITVGEIWQPKLACSDDGEALVSWTGRDCVTHYRVVSADHRHAGEIRSWSNPNDWFCGSPAFALWSGGYAITWQTTDRVTYESDVWLQSFDRSGTATHDALRLSSPARGWRATPIAGADAEGNVVASWEEQSGNESATVAVAVASDGRSSGTPTEVVRGARELVNDGPLRVLSGGVGYFEIVWTTNLAEWYVAQPLRIAELAQPTTTTTTTTTTLEDDSTPMFGDEHGWPRAGILEGIQPMLASDGNGGWLAMWTIFHGWWGQDWRAVSTSTNGGRSWSRESDFEFNALDILSAADGGWLSVGADWERDYDTNVQTLFVQLARSNQDATQWTAAIKIAAIPGPPDDDCWSRMYDLDVERSSNGTLVVAWAQYTSCDNHDAENTVDRAFAIRSLDDGKTWSEPVLLWTASFEGYDNGSSPTVSLFSARDDDFVMTLSRDAWVFMRSDDGGVTWSAPGPRILPSNTLCDSRGHCLAASDDFTWISDDGGASFPEIFSNPFDAMPTLATDDDGTWTAAWTSYRSLGGVTGPDADLLVSSSADGGRTWSAPRVLNSSAAHDEWAYDSEAVVRYDAGSWVALWSKRPPGTGYYDGYAPEPRVATAFARCGNGEMDVFEQCDDGNRTSGDGCDANCYVTACGNSAVTDGEECDDGNSADDDACVDGCRIARCGDGFTRMTLEECDDANPEDADACTTRCTIARCGDGIVAAGTEECDDGNTINEDPCPRSCRLARCGDGFVLDGVEECDDANPVTTDSCPSACRMARCGDGYVWQGIEPCDTGASPDCAKNCGLSDCGDANGDGQYTVSDARDILYRALDKPVLCPLDQCDVDGNFWISSRDSLMALGLSVGFVHPTRCTGGPWLTIRIQDTRALGALQLRVDLSNVPVSVLHRPNGVAACEGIQPDVLTAGGVSGDSLVIGMITSSTFRGPVDVVRCRVAVDGDVHPNDFDYTIEDVTTPSGDPVYDVQVVLRVTD